MWVAKENKESKMKSRPQDCGQHAGRGGFSWKHKGFILGQVELQVGNAPSPQQWQASSLGLQEVNVTQQEGTERDQQGHEN